MIHSKKKVVGIADVPTPFRIYSKRQTMKRTLLPFLLIFWAITLYAQTYVRKTSLPCIYINTEGNKAVSSKEDYLYATMVYVDENDQQTTYDSLQIRGRGNSTWNMRKKPYRIKFHNKEKFLGKGYAKAKSWTLLANAADKTMMRNAITSAMGQFLGLPFNPAAKFVDFVLNDVYYGTYQISDQVEVRSKRVDVVEQDYPLTDASDITGGYLLEVDRSFDGSYFMSSTYNQPVRIHYPDEDEIVDAQKNWIKDYVNQFEAALASSDFADVRKGYRRFVDSVSLANWYVATEVSANVDGFYSTYFYKEQGDSLFHWGPLWDYDIAYNNDNRTDRGASNTTKQLMADVAYSGTKDWVKRMWADPWFAQLIYRRYQQALSDGLVDFLHQKIDSLASLLDESQQLNYRKWGISTRMYHEMVLYSSYQQYVTDLKQFISDHTSYLLTTFASKQPNNPDNPDTPTDSTSIFVPENYYYRILNAGNAMAMEGGTSGSVYSYYNQTDRLAEEWVIRPVGKYFSLVNRSLGKALNDPSPTAQVGTLLALAEVDTTDNSQLWDIMPQGTEGYYNLRNVRTNHIANLSGGSSNAFANILSYTNDSRNATSKNRLWYFVKGDELTPDATGIDLVEPEEYALAYNRDQRYLHFGSETPGSLVFTAKVYDAMGRKIASFQASERCDVSTLPAGVYVVSWTVGGHHRSAKFSK